MKLIYVLFDSLNRHALGCHGGTAVRTPNLDRLAAKGTVFDTHYVGSLPCMPARRDMHTGRLNFLHRAWGPLEPFDNSFPELLREKGVYSHLVTDHYHYFEDGGVGFHGRYSSFEFIRGQEKDKWQGVVRPPFEKLAGQYHPTQYDGRTDPNANMPYYLTREAIQSEAEFPLALCVAAAKAFLERNRGAEDWLLQLECFDPHEPFFAAARFRDGIETGYRGPVLDWPRYGRPDYAGPEAEELRANYHALVAMCDAYLGRILDHLDRTGGWDDTAVIVTTDHGLLLGEHEYWGKNRPPFFNEVVHIPLIVWEPRVQESHGKRRAALTQTTDLMPTILEMFGAPLPEEVRGHSLYPVLRGYAPVREAALYGQFGAAANVTDGRYVYMRYPPPDAPAVESFHYTLMPTHMRTFFEPAELRGATLTGPFDFTKGVPVLKVPVLADAAANMVSRYPLLDARTVLYDLARDPGQAIPIEDAAVEARMVALLRRAMAEQAAPPEAYARLGLWP